jgi:hypothetical protein
MKKLIAILVVFLTSGHTGFSQEGSQDPYSEKLVTTLASRNAPIISMQEKAINRLGDRAAIGFVRHLGGSQSPSTPQEVQGILFVIRMAFASPEIISSEADREPKATSILLTYLSSLQTSNGVKQEIQQTRQFVEQQIKDYKLKQADTQK